MTNPASSYTILISDDLAGQRLDRALTAWFAENEPEAGLSRARLQQLLEAGAISKKDKPVTKANSTVQTGDQFEVVVPEPISAIPEAQDIPLTIVYEDDDLLVIDKPAGLVVHPAVGNLDNTLVNALLAHCGSSLSGIGGVKRPGIVHRLDKDTSGLIVVAKNDFAHQSLTSQFAAHSAGEGEIAGRTLSRTYLAVVHGLAPGSSTIDAPIGRDPGNRQRMAILSGGKRAVTHMERVGGAGTSASLVRCVLETGRTHQIRVHMSHIGYPLVGDPTYGKKRGLSTMIPALRQFPRQALHAAELTFKHPKTGKTLKFSSNLPSDMEELLLYLQNM